MENASKALIIAGGILLAMIILGALVYAWGAASNFQLSQDEQKKLEQITEFNREYESYKKLILRGSDIISVVNKVRDNNIKYADNANFQITWKFKIINGVQGAITPGTYTESNCVSYNNIINDDTKKDYLRRFKALCFKCSKIDYNNKTGRVNAIEFEEININQ